jgi:hemolysin activation/secretion protein
VQSGSGYDNRWRAPAGRALLCPGVALLALAGILAAAAPALAANPATAEKTPAGSNAVNSASGPDAQAGSAAPSKKPAATQHFDIDDFAVQGADTLPEIDIEEAIYPFLGPNRTSDDVEKARAALEKAYHDKGYQTVSVSVPEQNTQRKVITLKVTELKVGRLRVKNSRYFDLDKIKDKASSLKEGSVPNFNNVTKDIVARPVRSRPASRRRFSSAARSRIFRACRPRSSFPRSRVGPSQP